MSPADKLAHARGLAVAAGLTRDAAGGSWWDANGEVIVYIAPDHVSVHPPDEEPIRCDSEATGLLLAAMPPEIRAQARARLARVSA